MIAKTRAFSPTSLWKCAIDRRRAADSKRGGNAEDRPARIQEFVKRLRYRRISRELNRHARASRLFSLSLFLLRAKGREEFGNLAQFTLACQVSHASRSVSTQRDRAETRSDHLSWVGIEGSNDGRGSSRLSSDCSSKTLFILNHEHQSERSGSFNYSVFSFILNNVTVNKTDFSKIPF